MGIGLVLYFLWAVHVYLRVYESVKIEKDKIYLPLLVVVSVALTFPVILLISLLDFNKGTLIRQVVRLSTRFLVLKVFTRHNT